MSSPANADRDKAAGSGTFWSFDDPASMTNKMNYIKANDLGGQCSGS